MANNKNKIKEIKLADRVITLISKDGKFRAGVIKSSNLSKIAQSNHKLPPIPTSLLSRLLTAASLMAAFLKGEERIILEANGSGNIKKILAEAIQVGEVRGFVQFDSNNNNNTSISDFLGNGLFKVSKILYNKAEPIVGIVELKNGDISSDLAYYYQKSEQIPTAVILDVSLDDHGIIEHSGGFLVQALPGTSDKEINELYENIKNTPKITELLRNEMKIEDIARIVTPFDYEILKNYRVDFYCRCSKDKFISKLLTLGIDEIKKMKNDKHNELICLYCNKHYYLEEQDFLNLINELKAVEN